MMTPSNVTDPERIRIEFPSGSLPAAPSQVNQSWYELVESRRKSSSATFRGLPRTRWQYYFVRALSLLGYSLVPNKKTEGSASRFADETHHRFYGLPWCIGRDQMDFLVSRGLRPSHRVLDLGCGSLRTGIWLIPYLDNGNYFGVDAHLESLEAAVHYEIPLHRLEDKSPRLLLSSQFELSHFGVDFDWIVAFALLIHLDPQNQEKALRRMRSCLEPGGRVVLSHALPRLEKELTNEFGLVVAHREVRPCRLMDEHIEWFELTLSDGV